MRPAKKLYRTHWGCDRKPYTKRSPRNKHNLAWTDPETGRLHEMNEVEAAHLVALIQRLRDKASSRCDRAGVAVCDLALHGAIRVTLTDEEQRWVFARYAWTFDSELNDWVECEEPTQDAALAECWRAVRDSAMTPVDAGYHTIMDT
jgi:hypothetical protein